MDFEYFRAWLIEGLAYGNGAKGGRPPLDPVMMFKALILQVRIRRACSALHVDRSTYHYQSRRTDPAFLKKRIKEICVTHVRYGYRRVYYILRRDGWSVNMKKIYRIYRALGLRLRNNTPIHIAPLATSPRVNTHTSTQ
ncbi:IS3 family transposase [Blastomonas fulva]|uniref:IS3 family transposase n=1 Tax=Blastomonas fulva TaxID=1550728 RepID=UPI003D2E5A5A